MVGKSLRRVRVPAVRYVKQATYPVGGEQAIPEAATTRRTSPGSRPRAKLMAFSCTVTATSELACAETAWHLPKEVNLVRG
jgi:hypothetical protein